MKEEDFGTKEERALVIRDIKQWAEAHDNADTPIIFLDTIGKVFFPQELAEDIGAETALGVVMLDIIIFESRKAGVLPVDYVRRLHKVLRTFPKGHTRNEVN